jgi:hypothetical protein
MSASGTSSFISSSSNGDHPPTYEDAIKMHDEATAKIRDLDVSEIPSRDLKDITRLLKKAGIPEEWVVGEHIFRPREDMLVFANGRVRFYWIMDDSGSMTKACTTGSGKSKVNARSRWDELQQNARDSFDIINALWPEGVKVRFMNAGHVKQPVQSFEDMAEMFARGPRGGTPLVASLLEAFADAEQYEVPTLIRVSTDGKPEGGPDETTTRLEEIVRGRNMAKTFLVFDACTDNKKAIDFLNKLDNEDEYCVDVIDDMESEAKQIRDANGLGTEYTQKMHVARMFLGGVFPLYDAVDEPLTK